MDVGSLPARYRKLSSEESEREAAHAEVGDPSISAGASGPHRKISPTALAWTSQFLLRGLWAVHGEKGIGPSPFAQATFADRTEFEAALLEPETRLLWIRGIKQATGTGFPDDLPRNVSTALKQKTDAYDIKDDFPHPALRLSRREKEATRVAEWVKRLLTMEVVLEGEDPRPMTTDDIAILTPFRAHASAITKAILSANLPNPEKLRIGTVDKMQGQGAAVVLYSLASSSKDYIAQQTEWLLSANRWNVALSRAKACAIVVGDLYAHFSAVPNALSGIAAKQKIRELMADHAWHRQSPLPEVMESDRN